MIDITLRDLVYSPSSFRSFLAYQSRNMVLAYFAKTRDLFRRLATRPLELLPLVTGDVIYHDASRVSAREQLLVHLNAYGILCAPPLQVLTDTAAHLAAQEEGAIVPMEGAIVVAEPEEDEPAPIMDADEEVRDDPLVPTHHAVVVGQKGRGKGKAKAKAKGKAKAKAVRRPHKLEPTKMLLFALVQSLLKVLPFVDLTPWKASTYHVIEPGEQRIWDVAQKELVRNICILSRSGADRAPGARLGQTGLG